MTESRKSAPSTEERLTGLLNSLTTVELGFSSLLQATILLPLETSGRLILVDKPSGTGVGMRGYVSNLISRELLADRQAEEIVSDLVSRTGSEFYSFGQARSREEVAQVFTDVLEQHQRFIDSDEDYANAVNHFKEDKRQLSEELRVLMSELSPDEVKE